MKIFTEDHDDLIAKNSTLYGTEWVPDSKEEVLLEGTANDGEGISAKEAKILAHKYVEETVLEFIKAIHSTVKVSAIKGRHKVIVSTATIVDPITFNTRMGIIPENEVSFVLKKVCNIFTARGYKITPIVRKPENLSSELEGYEIVFHINWGSEEDIDNTFEKYLVTIAPVEDK
jgi:hypothetical protein